jgi:potassium/chloride transporter 9
VLDISGTPNFRPGFRFFSWKTSLLGVFVCGGVMFMLDPLYALLALSVSGFFGAFGVILHMKSAKFHGFWSILHIKM